MHNFDVNQISREAASVETVLMSCGGKYEFSNEPSSVVIPEMGVLQRP